MRRAIVAIALGLLSTVVLFGIAYLTAGTTASKVAYWQGLLLQSFVPGVNIGIAEHPVLEATPVHVLAFFAGLPLGAIVYSVLAYVMLGFLPNPTFQRTATPPLN